MNKKGQISPQSLEDIPALAIMLIMTMLFIVLIFSVVSGYLETNKAIDMHTSAVELANILETGSEIVYENKGVKKAGVLDSVKFTGFNPNKYGFIGYKSCVKIKDLRIGSEVMLGCDYSELSGIKNIRSCVSPVAIYSGGEVHEGLLNVFVWRE